MENVIINFIYEGNEFAAHKSFFNSSDAAWHLYYAGYDEDLIGDVSDPFLNPGQFNKDCEKLCKKYIKSI